MSKIRLLVLDVDGVLTDGKLYHGPDGQEWRSTHVRDGLGLKKLRQHGIQPMVISGRGPGGLDARLENLGVEPRYWGEDDKWPVLKAYLDDCGIAPEEVAMMGDDEPDLALMHKVGMALAPADALPAVRAYAHFVSPGHGGQGAVREAIEWLLEQQP